MKYHTPVCLLIIVVGAVTQSYAADGNDDLRSLSIPYSPMAGTAVGSGIDIDLVNQQRFTCLDFQPADVRWLDGDGAISTSASIDLVTSYESLAKTLDLEVDYKSKADVGIAALKAGGEVNLNVKYGDFAKDENRSLAFVISARSDYGRQGLQPFHLQEEFRQLVVDKNYEGFRKRCGTHSIVAVRRQSSTAVVLMISELTRSAKQSLELLYKTSVSAQGKIKVADVAASSEKSFHLKKLVESASKVGSLRIEFESKGGTGISDAMKAAISANPANVDQILTSVSQLSSSFTQANSAPTNFLLVSNSVFGVTSKIADASKLDKLNSYFLQLSRIDYSLARIGSYRESFAEVYSKFYTTTFGQLRNQRNQLINAIEGCVLEDKCDYQMPASTGVLFLEDILQPETVQMSCSYKQYPINDVSGKIHITEVLSAINVTLEGKIRLADYVAVQTATLSRFGPDAETIKIIPGFASLAVAKAGNDGSARMSAILDHKPVPAKVKVSVGSVVVENLEQVTALRETVQNSIYSVGMQARNGVSIMNTVGPPYGGNCPVIKNL